MEDSTVSRSFGYVKQFSARKQKRMTRRKVNSNGDFLFVAGNSASLKSYFEGSQPTIEITKLFCYVDFDMCSLSERRECEVYPSS